MPGRLAYVVVLFGARPAVIGLCPAPTHRSALIRLNAVRARAPQGYPRSRIETRSRIEMHDDGRPAWWRTRGGIAVFGFGLVIAFYILREHYAHVLGAPYLLLLAHPL